MEQQIKDKEDQMFIDQTEMLDQVAQQLDQNQFLEEQNFSLFDAMQASQLCDEKMDFKVDLNKCDTIEKLVESGKIKSPEQLDEPEILCLFDLVQCLEMIWLEGQSLSETTFTFVYLYDDKLAARNGLIYALTQNIHYVGNVAFNFIRKTNFMNEDDYIACFFGFKYNVDREQYQQVVELIIEQENKIKDKLSKISKAKKKKNQEQKLNIYDAVDSRLKFRRLFSSLVNLLDEKFSIQTKQQILELVLQLEKKLKTIDETRHFYSEIENDIKTRYLSQSIVKTINSLNNRRPQQKPDFEQMLKNYQNFFEHLKFILEMYNESNYFSILQKIKQFMEFPKNILSHVYLDQQIFGTQYKYFHQEEFSNILYVNTIE